MLRLVRSSILAVGAATRCQPLPTLPFLPSRTCTERETTASTPSPHFALTFSPATAIATVTAAPVGACGLMSAALLVSARHAATAGGSSSNSGGAGGATDGKGGSSSSTSGGGGGAQHGAKASTNSKKKKTKLVKKIVHRPRTTAGAAGNTSSHGGGSSSNSTSASPAATSVGGSAAAGGAGGGTHASAAAAAALKNKPKKLAKKVLLKKKKRPAAAVSGAGGAAAGSVGGSSGTAGGATTTTTATGHGGGSGSSSSHHTNASSHSNSHSGGGTRGSASPTTSAAKGKRKKRKKLSKKLSTSSTTASAAGHQASRVGSSSSSSSSSSKARGRKKKKALGSPSRTGLASKVGRPSGSGGSRVGTGKANSAAAARTAASSGGRGGGGRKSRQKKLRICVLNSSYDGADSATAAVDNFLCTPEHYAKKDKKKYTFGDVSVKKIDSYRAVRELVTSGRYDVFFNLCDGGRDEKRAGIDVVQALEEMNAAFTGTDSRSFEPSKIDMKLLVGSCGVKVPNFVLLENAESLAKKCRHLRFPVIVKHLSGYASVGIHKDNRCDDLDQLKKKVPAFIKEYNHALVEEFIRGREGTVLACADTASPHGVKVFRPLMFNFLKDGDDFAYFDKKWGMNCDDSAYGFLPHNDPAYPAIVEMARNAYKFIMNGVGYGRVDFRIDERTGEPNFLEINPNCGMWYSEKDGGDFADIMVQGDPTWSHERFLANAVSRALREQAARKPWYFISHDKTGQFSTRASRTVPAGKCLFGDAVHPIPVVTKSLFKLGAEEPSVGAVICRGDGVHQAVAIRHSCEPNMHFVHGRTLLFAAKRQINVGEELTVDYATLRDESMPTFACGCGTQNCRSVIFAMPATARTLEVKAVKKMLREKKRLWMNKRNSEREAERLLKKRAAAASLSASSGSSSGGSSSSGTHSSSHGAAAHGTPGGSGGASSSTSGSTHSGGAGSHK